MRELTVLVILAAVSIITILSLSTYLERDKFIEGVFVRHNGTETLPFRFEITADQQTRARGLMFRKSLPQREGMLFVFPTTDDHSFWMRNTFISLDIIFLGEDFRVVGILENVPILNDQLRKIGAKSLYAVELAAGSAKKHGIEKGVLLKLNKPPPKGK